MTAFGEIFLQLPYNCILINVIKLNLPYFTLSIYPCDSVYERLEINEKEKNITAALRCYKWDAKNEESLTRDRHTTEWAIIPVCDCLKKNRADLVDGI